MILYILYYLSFNENIPSKKYLLKSNKTRLSIFNSFALLFFLTKYDLGYLFMIIKLSV